MGIDVIDFTELQKKGIIKQSKFDDAITTDTLDMTSSNVPSIFSPPSLPQPSIQTTPSANEGSTFDFLDSFSQLGAQNPGNVPSHVHQSLSPDIDVKLDGIANKLEDAMYKLETLISRIVQLESRIDSLGR